MNKKTIAKASVFIALMAVCVYTVWFGTIKSPVDYTMSTIGNYFNLRTDFMLWGTITGILLVACSIRIYRAAGCNNISSDRFLALSFAFLIMTVIVPNIKEISMFLFYVHVAASVLFAVCLLISIAIFIRHLYMTKIVLFKKALKLIIFSVTVPLAIIAAYGKITSLAEMTFFVCISLFFLIMNSQLAGQNAAGAVIR